jgi:hypothetical protein
MISQSTFRALLLSLAMLSVAAPARALEDQRFTAVHGTICHVTNDVVPFLSTAGIGNPSTSSNLNLDCPIPLTGRSQFTYLAATHTSVDTHGNFLGSCGHTDTVRVPWVEVYDRNPNTDVVCNLLVLGDGNSIQSTFTVHSTGSQGLVQKLKFPMQAFLRLASTNRLFVQCQVPPKASDFSYIARFGFPTCEGS